MTFEIATYTIVPPDNLVLIGSEAAFGVDFNGQLQGVNAIHWWDSYNQGEMEFLPTNPVTGEKPPNVLIDDFSPFTTYVYQAQAILEAQANPAVYYSTIPDNVHQGVTYSLGEAIVISTPNPIQPADTTPDIPPTPESYQKLYWTGTMWVVSAFDITETLSEAQSTLTTLTLESGAEQVDAQSRIYSSLQLATDADPSALMCADYPTTSLGDYQSLVDAQVSSQLTEIQAATTTEDLYPYDPTVTVTI